MSTEPPVLFLSLKPRFAEKILSGEKTVELRRVQPSVGPDTLVVLYASSPLCRVLGTGRVQAIESASPTTIWERHKRRTGVTRSEFRDYFDGVSRACAILLTEVERLEATVSLAALRDEWRDFRPPQSFRYLDPGLVASVI